MRPSSPTRPKATAVTVDGQRQRVYDAEQRVGDQLDFAARGATTVVVYGSTLTLAPDVRFGSLATAQRWLDHLRQRRWLAERWPGAAARAVALRPRRGQRGAHYERDADGGTIAVPVPGNTTGWAMRELVLIHELAHHVVTWDLDHPDAGLPLAPHGGEFAAVMLELVGGVLGPETRLLLAAAYHDGEVEIAPASAVTSPASADPSRQP